MIRNILFVAYLYPPVGGLGLPGVQRIVKLVKYLDYDCANVLTVRPDYYPEHVDLNNTIKLPVKKEVIHRTKIIDSFKILIKIKECFRKIKRFYFLRRNSNLSKPINDSNEIKSNVIWDNKVDQSLLQQLWGLISNLFYFPDYAAPWIIPAIFKGLKIIKKHKITVIFATGMPWSALTVAYILSKITGVPLVTDFRDPWIGNPFLVSKGKLLDNISGKLERCIIKHAQLVTANTKELRNNFVMRYSLFNSNKFITLPNGYDIIDYQLISRIKKQPNHDESKNNIVLAHAGFLYGERDPFPVIEAIRRVLKFNVHNRSITFLQIGKISLNYDFYERFKDLLSNNKIIIIDQLPYEQCLEKLLQVDVLLNIQPKTKTQVPSKLYDYLCLNLPILTIAPLNGALGNIVRQYGFGDIFDPNDIDGIFSCLLGLWQKKQEQGKLTVNYPNRQSFDVRKIANYLSQSLNNIGI